MYSKYSQPRQGQPAAKSVENIWKSNALPVQVPLWIKIFFLAFGILLATILCFFNAHQIWLQKLYQQLIQNPPETKTVKIEQEPPKELVNFAASYNNATIDYSGTSRSYFEQQSLLFGKRWVYRNPAQKLLSDDNSPGECWAMMGSTGQVTIQFPYKIFPRSFQIKHAYLIQSQRAPKEVCLYGSGKLACVQFKPYDHVFECEENCDRDTNSIRVVIESNYGASDTCIYQILVHGEIDKKYNLKI